jgi:hypothetical protein
MQNLLKSTCGLITAFALLVPALTGCEERPARDRELEPAPPAAEPIPPAERDPFMDDRPVTPPAADRPQVEQPDRMLEPQMIDVTLRENQIDMPATMPAGPVRLRITNASDSEQQFVLHGPGVHEELEQALEPGQSATLETHLRPGEYTAGSPDDENMQVTLNVQEQQGQQQQQY